MAGSPGCGDCDAIAMWDADNGSQLNALIADIGLLDGVAHTTASFILATKIER